MKQIGAVIPKKCWVGESHKICYNDESEASGEARMMEIRSGLQMGEVTTYVCEFCGKWHLSRNKGGEEWKGRKTKRTNGN